MCPTKKSTIPDAGEPPSILHLVATSSEGRPLCGTTSPDAVIGSYCEHLDGERWVREVLGKDGKPGTPCQLCLARYLSLLYRNSLKNEDGWPLFVMLAKWHLAVPAIAFLIWLLWKLCHWIATTPHPPRVP